MEAPPWVIDWNPAFEDDPRMKQTVLQALRQDGVADVIDRLAQRAIDEVAENGFETEHLVWLDTGGRFALFVRVWYEHTQNKVFCVVEENDLGDVCFLILDEYDCASYERDQVLEVKIEEPDTLGVEP
jgi:hypothetical protein